MKDFNKSPLPETYKEISIYDLLKFQECPKKYEHFLEERQMSPTEEFAAICRRHVTGIARDALMDKLSGIDSYHKRAVHDVENSIYGLSQSGKSKQYTDRIQAILSRFMNVFIYGEDRTGVGMGLPQGVTEAGIRVLAGSDYTIVMNRSKQTRTYIYTFGSEITNPFFNGHVLRAAIIHEGYLREGIRAFVYLYNLNTGEESSYDHPRLHKNLLKTVASLLGRLREADYYYNIGSWCTYCTYLQDCYRGALLK